MGIGTRTETIATLTDVIARDALPRDPFGGGVGVDNSGTMIITGGEFSQNAFAGIANIGELHITGAMIDSNQGYGFFLNGGASLLENVTITNNGLDGSYRAGALISSGAEVTVSNSVFTNNYQVGVLMRGGGGGNLTMENSMVRDNPGYGLSIEEGSATLNNVTVSNNGELYRGTSGSPGGIQNRGTLNILNSQITGNLNGGLSNETGGRLTVTESIFTDNSGGLPAITNSGDANIQTSLIADNTIPLVTSNAAIDNRGTMSLSNSTISGNIGFGISAIDGDLSLNFDTIAENTEGGLAAFHGGEVVSRISNTLIVKNGGRGNCVDIGFGYPALPLAGTNIETTPFIVTDVCGFPEVYSPDEILLNVLADNGGPTLTHALLPGSPALDAATGLCIEVDQRLFPRPFGPGCDVGAYEAGGVATSQDFPTATPELPMLTLTKDFPCYTGPGSAYDTLGTLKAGTQMQIVGYSFTGGWLVAYHPTLQGRPCWIDQDFAIFDVPVEQLRLIAVPPKPTPSPTNEERQPTVCVTVGKNTVCH